MSQLAAALIDKPVHEVVVADLADEIKELLSDPDIDSLILNVLDSRQFDVDMRGVVLDVETEITIEGSSNMVVTLWDPDKFFVRSEALRRDADVRLPGGRWYRLDTVEKLGDELQLVFIDRNIHYMMVHKKLRKMTRNKHNTRAEFIALLVRYVNRGRANIKIISPELHKRQPIAKGERERPARTRARSRSAPGFASGFTPTVKGAPADPRQKRVLAAVLATLDSMGGSRKVLLAGYVTVVQESLAGKLLTSSSGQHHGPFHQDASYGSVEQRRDVEHAARGFGRKAIAKNKANPNLSVHDLAESVQISGLPREYARWRNEAERAVDNFSGGGSRGSSSETVTRKKRYEFRVNKGEGYWATTQRLVSEVNWRAFFTGVNDELYLISEEDLFRAKSRATLREGENGVERITWKYAPRRTVNECTVTARVEDWFAPPGTVVVVDGEGPADGRYLVTSFRRSRFSLYATIALRRPMEELPEPANETESRVLGRGDMGPVGSPTTTGGAKAIVDFAARIAARHGTYVGSDFREGSRVGSGELSDHAFNDTNRAARDIGVEGINLLTGPPSPKLDRAVVEIGQAFGRDYGDGRRVIIDTFNWRGFRIQIIWRTPKYGGHMGHIHIGARKL